MSLERSYATDTRPALWISRRAATIGAWPPPRPPDRSRHVVPAPRGRWRAHARRVRARVRRGPAGYDELVDAIETRLHLVPRYRQRLAAVPFGQGRPVWVDDPHFSASYHIRHAAVPAAGSELELKALAGRLFAQPLDRDKPLWEIWLVEGLQGDRFAVIGKTHHALVDGVSGVDITAILFDASRDPSPVAPPARSGHHARRRPTRSCWRTRCSSARPCRPRRCVACVR